jgi:hypothetical protein
MERFSLKQSFDQPFFIKCRLLVLTLSLWCWSGFTLADTHTANEKAHPWLGPQLLYAKYQSIQPELQHNAFGEPFYLKANVQDELTTGDAYADLPYAYPLVSGTLVAPLQLCKAIMLHINVKGCVVEDRNHAKPIIKMYVGTKEYQNPEHAFKVSYEFTVDDHNDKYTLISMIAEKGPLNTENIAIYVECLAITPKTSFMHFTYSARYGSLARLALNTYLATLGRHKVGFTATGTDKHGEPIYIKGIQGVVERNTMRYFFALESYFDTYNKPYDASLNRWFDYVDKYPKQLYEMPRDEYIKAKHHELRDTEQLQLKADASGESSQ